MSARDKYLRIFGQMESLAECESWTRGLSNMFEWLCWSPDHILGVTKAEFQRMVVEWAQDAEVRSEPIERKLLHVREKLKHAMAESEQSERYAARAPGVKSPRESLRCAKFLSEDYLNKEFDIFWGLVSDDYLDAYYSRFTTITGGGSWFSHGNSGNFAASTNIKNMQMDNLSYCPEEGLLVANELKLGGKKNQDQILKYSLMFRKLKESGFIRPESRFLLLFIGSTKWAPDWQAILAEEVQYCQRSKKSTHAAALSAEDVARATTLASTTWQELVDFNCHFMNQMLSDRSGKVDRTRQVEWKLLSGFNESLKAKKDLVHL